MSETTPPTAAPVQPTSPAPSLISKVESYGAGEVTKAETFFESHPLAMFGAGLVIGACVAMVLVHTFF